MQTVISVFENRQAAQRAVDRLFQAGFDSLRVHRHEGAAPANTATAASPSSPEKGDFDEDHGLLSSIGHFFARVFGQEAPTGYADRYVEMVRRGQSVVVVQAKDDEEKDRATTIVSELGAIDIAENAPEWQDEDMRAGTSSSTGVVMGTGQRMQSPSREPQEGAAVRAERERAVAADQAREKLERENDLEAREPRITPIPRDI